MILKVNIPDKVVAELIDLAGPDSSFEEICRHSFGLFAIVRKAEQKGRRVVEIDKKGKAVKELRIPLTPASRDDKEEG